MTKQKEKKLKISTMTQLQTAIENSSAKTTSKPTIAHMENEMMEAQSATRANTEQGKMDLEQGKPSVNLSS